jgi:hypothetical protein
MPLNEFRRRSNPLGAILFDLMHVNGVAFTREGKLVALKRLAPHTGRVSNYRGLNPLLLQPIQLLCTGWHTFESRNSFQPGYRERIRTPVLTL